MLKMKGGYDKKSEEEKKDRMDDSKSKTDISRQKE